MASDFAREMIKRHDGKENRLYDDRDGKPIVKGKTVEGYPTIGYGWNLQARGLPDHIIDELFEISILDAEASLLDIFGPTIFQESEARVAALLDMVFNLGESGLRSFTKMIQAVKKGDWETAANEAEDSRWAVQVVARAKEVISLLRTGNHDVGR